MKGADRPVGAHAPTAGGLAKAALPYIDATGAETVQVLVGNPRGWARSAGDVETPSDGAVGHATDIATLQRLRG
jgi:hypothetical protein